MEAILHVKNLAYCKLEIEDANMPASFNLVDHIMIQEGFGIAIPTLTLFLMDKTGTLQNDLNIVQGTKCSITLARMGASDRMIRRTFSLWGMRRGNSNEGPHLQLVFILDVPQWSAGVYCENFRTTSSEAIQNMALRSGIRYSGPDGGTDDTMNWLNINTTRSSFSEDIAMRGYAGDSSCMARVLTMDNELRYKDLFAVMRKDHKGTFCHNAPPDGETNPYPVKEAQDMSMSGVMAHWFNYGAIQHEHSLDASGQKVTDRMLAPVLGDAFPISQRVKGLISDAVAARVTYTGWDPGTEPNPGSNVHQNYERAFYQNLRGLGLFSEKIRTMITVVSDIGSLDSVRYVQRDPIGPHLVDSRSLNGKYLVAGKTIRIKNGHAYSEIFDLVRSYITLPGKSSMTSGSGGNNKAAANAGSFDLAGERSKQLNQAMQNQEVPERGASLTPIEPEMVRAKILAQALNDYDKANPRIPETVAPTAGTLSPVSVPVRSQLSLQEAINSVKKDSNPIASAIDQSKAGFDPKDSYTVKRISSSAIKTSANETITALKQYEIETGKVVSGVEGLPESLRANTSVKLEKPILDRFSSGGTTGGDVLKEKFDSYVTPTSAEGYSMGAFVGDLQKGGVFVQDFLDNGTYDPERWAGHKLVDTISQQDNLGTNFVFPASKFGLKASDIQIGPKEVAEFLLDYAEQRKDPEQFLKDKGADAYYASFGDYPPQDAKELAQDVIRLSGEAVGKYGDGEVLIGSVTTDTVANVAQTVSRIDSKEEAKSELAYQAYQRLQDANPNATIRSTGIQAGLKLNTGSLAQQAIRDPEDKRGYVDALDFQFGEKGVSPVLEKVVDKARYGTGTSSAEVVRTTREMVSWATYTKIGSDEAARSWSAQDGVFWEFPHAMPFKPYVDEHGTAHDLPDTVTGPNW